MFSRKMVIIVAVIILITVNFIGLSISGKRHLRAESSGRISVSFIAPFQKIATLSIRYLKGIWKNYFYLVAVREENEYLRKELSLSLEKLNQYREMELFASRFEEILRFQKNIAQKALAAQIIGIDPSPWYKTVIIDKGTVHGVKKGMPVVVPEGIVGQIMEGSSYYSKVIFIIDRNSAVDALVQRTRARGILKGESTDECFFQYALRKHDIDVADIIVSSGLDGVYPKGLRIGEVISVVRNKSGIFQEVKVKPFVDFERLEDVLVLLTYSYPKDENK